MIYYSFSQLITYQKAINDFKDKLFFPSFNYKLSITLKIHVIIDQYQWYFEYTGKTIQMANLGKVAFHISETRKKSKG